MMSSPLRTRRTGRPIASVLDPLEQKVDGLAAQCIGGLRERGESRRERRGPGKVVEADDGDVARALEAAVGDGLDHAQRHHIRGAEDRFGTVRALEQGQPGLVRPLDRRPRRLHQVRIKGDAGVLQRLPVAGQPLGDRYRVDAVRQRGDPTIAAVDQMPGEPIGSVAIVDDHGIGLDAFQVAVGEDERHARTDQLFEIELVSAGRDDDQALDPLFLQDIEIHALPVDMLVGVAEHDVVAAVAPIDAVLDSAHEIGKKRVGDIRYDDADRRGLGPPQASGDAVAPVSELVDRLLNALAGLRRHVARIVHDVRHRRGGYARRASHVVDGRHETPAMAPRWPERPGSMRSRHASRAPLS